MVDVDIDVDNCIADGGSDKLTLDQIHVSYHSSDFRSPSATLTYALSPYNASSSTLRPLIKCRPVCRPFHDAPSDPIPQRRGASETRNSRIYPTSQVAIKRCTITTATMSPGLCFLSRLLQLLQMPPLSPLYGFRLHLHPRQTPSDPFDPPRMDCSFRSVPLVNPIILALALVHESVTQLPLKGIISSHQGMGQVVNPICSTD